MNLQHLRYAVEVANCRSITKAAARLFIGQPNLSRAIRELEDEFGAPLFRRTSTGMIPTVQGEAFLEHAKIILNQIGEIHALGHPDQEQQRMVLNLTVPRASYIAHAFANTVSAISGSRRIAVNYAENNSMQAINDILSGASMLAVIRYPLETEAVTESMLRTTGLDFRPVMDFTPVVLLSQRHPLAEKGCITQEMLHDSIEILHGDPFVPSLSPARPGPASPLPESRPPKSICVYERGSQFDLLRDVPSTFMWVSPMPQRHLNCNGLVQLRCTDATARYRDLLIYRRGHRFSSVENMFSDQLARSIRHVLTLTEAESSSP